MRRAALEIAAVVLTGAVFLVFENVLHRKLEFLIPCAVLWTAYIVRRLRAEPGLARDWGFRADNLRAAAARSAAVAGAAAAGILAWRLASGWEPLPPGAYAVLALYPAWALIQQFLAQALVARNLRLLGAPPLAVVPAAAALFGLAHAPDWPLVGLCAAAGLAWTTLYLRTPNLWTLALSHALLGTLTYYWVLERDPWAQFFGPTAP